MTRSERCIRIVSWRLLKFQPSISCTKSLGGQLHQRIMCGIDGECLVPGRLSCFDACPDAGVLVTVSILPTYSPPSSSSLFEDPFSNITTSISLKKQYPIVGSAIPTYIPLLARYYRSLAPLIGLLILFLLSLLHLGRYQHLGLHLETSGLQKAFNNEDN
jgi:hypothetical protein